MDMTILERVFWHNRILDYIIALCILLVTGLFVKLVIVAVVAHLKKLAEKTTTTFDDLLVQMLEKIVLPALYLSCLYVSLKSLTVPPEVDRALNIVQMAVVMFFAARIVMMSIGYSLQVYLSKKQEDITLVRSLEGMLKVVKFLIWGIAAVIFLDNIGFKVSTLLAGLGIGGVAVAIAAQALLKDFFSYFCIVFDRPFKLGDFIIVGDYMGTVEQIGVKTTRIRSLSGEQLIFSNTDLTDSRVRNYKVMEKRRIVFRLGVTYQTTLAQLKEVPRIIEQAVRDTKDTAFDRAHFFSYGDFSLIFEVVYFVLSPDYNKYMDIQQEINFRIKEEFEKRKIEFAYPTQTLFVNKAA